MAVHPRLSVNSICSYGQSLEDDIALWRDLGVDHVALILPKIEDAGWAEAQALVIDAGLRVSTIFGPTYRPLDADPALGWRAEDQAGTDQTLDLASKIGAGSVYICTGAATTMTWDDAAEAFCEFLAPSVALAESLSVPLLLEPTNPMRIDVSFVFWQRDAMDLARQAGTKVMLDFQSSWFERDLRSVVRDNIDLIHMVQLSDYVVGTSQTGDRAVPGDGDIPLEYLVGMVLEEGFEGTFDLELMGPRIEAEGYASVIRRAVDRSSELLDRLGA